MLTNEKRVQITKALQQWANQTSKDQLVIELVSGDRFLTPFQVCDEVERNTLAGQAVLKILEHGVQQDGLQEVVNRLTDQASDFPVGPFVSSPSAGRCNHAAILM